MHLSLQLRNIISGAVLLALVGGVGAQSSFAPTAVFFQAGTTGHTHELTAGATWDWAQQWLYETDRKRFSTTFNFGDHLAVGRNFGQRSEHELSLRLQHFSNGGIKHPNPGEDFIQLRYAYRFL